MEESSSDSLRRKALRWTGFDYRTLGIYFVTICTANRLPLLGRVDDTGRLHPSPIGWAVSEAWHQLPRRFPNLELIAFVAMPDHVHGLLEMGPNAGEGPPHLALGRIISVFKSVANHQVRNLDGRAAMSGSIFQRGYHDRVVRSDEELRHIEWYIAENPARWAASRMSSGDAGSDPSLA